MSYYNPVILTLEDATDFLRDMKGKLESPTFTAAFQKLEDRIEELQGEIDELKNSPQALMAELKRIENAKKPASFPKKTVAKKGK